MLLFLYNCISYFVALYENLILKDRKAQIFQTYESTFLMVYIEKCSLNNYF